MTKHSYDLRAADHHFFNVKFSNLENKQELLKAKKNGDIVEAVTLTNQEGVIIDLEKVIVIKDNGEVEE